MSLYSHKAGIRMPLFKVLVFFAVTFFIYNDFNIRMMIGYAVLVMATIAYILFSNSKIATVHFYWSKLIWKKK